MKWYIHQPIFHFNRQHKTALAGAPPPHRGRHRYESRVVESLAHHREKFPRRPGGAGRRPEEVGIRARMSSRLAWRRGAYVRASPLGAPEQPLCGVGQALPFPTAGGHALQLEPLLDRKSTRLNSSHSQISYAVFCLKQKHIMSLGLICATAPAGTTNRVRLQCMADCTLPSIPMQIDSPLSIIFCMTTAQFGRSPD